MKRLILFALMCLLPLCASAQKETGFFVGAGGGMNFGFDGSRYDDRETSHNGAGWAGDFYVGGFFNPTIGVRAGYQGFGISERYIDFGNRKYNYVHGDLLLRAHRNIIPYAHAGYVKIVNPSWGAGAGVMFPIHLGRRVSIIPDFKATAFNSRAFLTGQNNIAVALSATLGIAIRLGRITPPSQTKVVPPADIQFVYVRDTVVRQETVKEVVKEVEVVHDTVTVYVRPEIREPESISALALFDTDKYNLRKEVLPELDKIAAWFLVHPNAKGRIEGHTDNTATAKHNQTLSENRARAVYEYLVEAGVPASRLSYIGYGLTRPVAPNTTPEGRQKNRRVEIHVEE